jgi:hypothetical protein
MMMMMIKPLMMMMMIKPLMMMMMMMMWRIWFGLVAADIVVVIWKIFVFWGIERKKEEIC